MSRSRLGCSVLTVCWESWNLLWYINLIMNYRLTNVIMLKINILSTFQTTFWLLITLEYLGLKDLLSVIKVWDFHCIAKFIYWLTEWFILLSWIILCLLNITRGKLVTLDKVINKWSNILIIMLLSSFIYISIMVLIF